MHDIEENNTQDSPEAGRFLIIKIDKEKTKFNIVSPFLVQKWLAAFSKNIKAKIIKENPFAECQDTIMAKKVKEAKSFENLPITVTLIIIYLS